ncbi:class I SAM-dependent methyltransferase [Ktedonosporobacter rubrisoli]|nr:class I SAM-dependent methyltransferase [Ktedonosporobacter rubrisoli]
MSTPAEQSGTDYVIDAENVAEMARLTRQARFMTQALGLLPTPLDLTTCQKVLDIGCGPGEWIRELAERYRGLSITGIDTSKAMIGYARYLAQEQNLGQVNFQLMDARSKLAFADNSFDLVHARFVSGFLDRQSWPLLLAESLRVLGPNGILCVTEPVGMGFTTSPAFSRYQSLLAEAWARSGRTFFAGDQWGITPLLFRLVEQAGFGRVQSAAHVLNYSHGGPAHQDIIDDWRTALVLLQPFICKTGVASQEELDLLYARAMEEMQAPDFCAVLFFQTVWGYKPA